MESGDFEHLLRRTASYKALSDKVLNIVKSPNYDGYQRYLTPTSYKFLDEKYAAMGARSETLVTHTGTGSNSNVDSKNQRPLDLSNELHKPII